MRCPLLATLALLISIANSNAEGRQPIEGNSVGNDVIGRWIWEYAMFAEQHKDADTMIEAAINAMMTDPETAGVDRFVENMEQLGKSLASEGLERVRQESAREDRKIKSEADESKPHGGDLPMTHDDIPQGTVTVIEGPSNPEKPKDVEFSPNLN
ncbi:hypothetical protein HB777_14570 [Mesorhizobium loti]|nr:hypothetical protein HB777_14570 [Mesorhizobium loti]